MITKLNHVSIFVLDQDSAYEFYVNKLGFKVHTDASMGPGMRWLTVCPPEQPDLEITLMAISEGMMFKKEAAAQMRDLVRKGTFGFGVFECNDLLATYEELKAKGWSLPRSQQKSSTVLRRCLKTTRGIGFRWAKKNKCARISRMTRISQIKN
jgi:catechol 2,3-dioxygenase-like lactoylglutathione lyase family enzyme